MAKDEPEKTERGPGVAAADRMHAALLADYPGAALVVAADGSPVYSNAKAAGLEALIRHDAAPEIKAMVGKARQDGSITAGSVSLNSAKGEIVLEVTVLPAPGNAGDMVVMARDMTMERNLRSALVESRQRYKDLVEVSSDFSWETNAEGAFVFVSPRGALGYKPEDLIDKKAEEFVISPEEFSPLPFVSRRELDNVEIWMRHKDGSTVCVNLSCVPLMAGQDSDAPEWKGARGVCRNVTEERENESALARARRREQHLNYIVSTIRDELEPQNMLSAAAAATARALGVAGCRIFRRTDDAFMTAAEHGNTKGLEAFDEKLKGIGDSGDVIEHTIGKWRVLASSTHYRQRVNGAISIWKAASDEPWDDDHYILISDVANQLGIANEQISNHERIVALSRTDGLTGLLNRRAFFEEELPRRIARLDRNRQTAALFFVDMDNFKAVNDIHGHQAGDDAILFLRDMLMEMSRPGDVIARLGGDEFAMWLDGITPEVSEERAKRLLEASEAMRKFSGSDDKLLGVSVGVAIFDPDDEEPLDDLLARADEAMYEVKNAGKGGYRMAKPANKSARASGGGTSA